MADEGFKRKLTSILSADAVGYSRLMEDDEEATVRTLTSYREVITMLIKQHNGMVIDSPGDNLLADFVSVVDAVQCAVSIQNEINARNENMPENRRMDFRIGINLGDVIQKGERIYGDGVNIAARLEGLSDPGGICISKTAFDQIETKLPFGYEFIGEQEVKNIAKPVSAYRVLMDAEAAGKVIGEVRPKTKQLRGVAIGAMAVLIVVAGVLAIWNFYFRPTFELASVERMAFPLPDKPSIAVLPFTNISGDPEQEYFSNGLTEEIITALSKVPQLFVIARKSTFSYKGEAVKVREVAEGLGVRYVLKGSIREDGERVRITTQLIDALNGYHLWAERYEKDLKDIFSLQDEIAIKIITALQLKLTDGEQARLAAKRTENLEAYLKYLQAREHFFTVTKEGTALARPLVKEAIALDPEYAPAYNLLGATHYTDVLYGVSKSPKQSLAKSMELIKKAIALDDSYPGAHSQLGWLYVMTRKYEKAIEECERAVALAPNAANSHVWLSIALRYAGRHEEALRMAEQALRLNPIPPGYYFRSLGIAYIFAGRYEEAITTFKKSRDLAPNDFMTHLHMAIAHIQAGQKDEAHAAIAEVLRIRPKYSLEFLAKSLQYKKKTDKDLYFAALRKAGLPETPPLSLPDKPSLAVLPFVNMSGDQEQEYFSDGISEEIITALSKTPKLLVIARTSSFKYKGKQVDIRTVGMELGVRYVLEGSVRKAGDKVRITAQLIDATTEKNLWAERYDRNLREIFDIQDEITLAIIKAMQVELTKGEMSDLTGRGTKNLDAYLKALQAQEQWWRMDKQGNLKAKQLALKAIAIDGQYGYPYAILSWSHMMDVWLQSSESPKESLRLAGEAIQKALILDESDYRIHIVLSNLYIMQRENDKAIYSAQRAVELCPGGAIAQAVLGTALRFACRFDESVQFREQAIRLDPFPIALEYRNLALAYSSVGRYDDAITEYKKALHTNPNDWAVHFGMVGAYTRLNRKEEARIAAKELLRVRPDFSLDWLAETIVPMYAKECRSKINDDIEFLRKADVGLQ
jgi:adenylate cyclase